MYYSRGIFRWDGGVAFVGAAKLVGQTAVCIMHHCRHYWLQRVLAATYTGTTLLLNCCTTSCRVKVYYSTDQPDATSSLSCLFSPPFSPFLPSVAQTSLHPANVVKTLLQTKGSFAAILPLTWATLSRGAGAQFLLSLPNGALHFAVLEVGTLISLPVYTIAAKLQQCVEAN